MANALTSFLGGVRAGEGYKDDVAARTYGQKQIEIAEKRAGYERDVMDMDRAMALAGQLGVDTNGGLGLDTEKLAAVLQKGRSGNKFNPLAEELATLIANTDYSVRKNPGFSFKGFNVGPDNTLTMRGSYDGEQGEKMATTGGGSGAEEEVAFAPVEQVAVLLSDQYDQMWSKRANASAYNEISKKQKLAGSMEQSAGAQLTISKAVGDLREQVDLFLASSKDPAYSKASRKLKDALSRAASDDEKLDILRHFGSELNLPVNEVITPEVEEAVAGSQNQATAAPTQQPQPDGGPATDEEIADFRKQNPTLFPSATRERLAQLVEGEKFGYKRASSTVPVTGPATDEEIVDFRKQNPTLFPSATRERLAQLVEGEKFGYKRGAPPATDPIVESMAKKAEEVPAGNTETIDRPSAEEMSALKTVLEAKGVKSFADINNANLTEQKALLSVLSRTAEDSEQRNYYAKALTNLIETGTLSFDAKSATEASLNQQKQNTSEEQTRIQRMGAERLKNSFRYEVGKNLNTFVENQVNKVGELFFDEDGEIQTPSVDDYYAKANGLDGSLSVLFRRLMGAKKRQDGSGAPGESRSIAQQEYNGLKDALLAQISFGMQFVSQDGGLELSLATDSDAPLTGSDATLSRIEREGAASGAGGTSGIRIKKPGSTQTDGDAFTAEQVSSFFGGNAELITFFFTSLDEIKNSKGR